MSQKTQQVINVKNELKTLYADAWNFNSEDGYCYIKFTDQDELQQAYAFIKNNASFILSDGETGLLMNASSLLTKVDAGDLILECDFVEKESEE